MNNGSIGFMDSGVGGLSVAKVAMEQMPNENIIYFGDEARLPYGEKTPKEIRKYSKQISKFLMNKKIKMLVIACNTATAHALNYLRDNLDIPVIGVIEPGSIAALKTTKTNRIGIIATNGTVKSGAYNKAINKLNNKVKIYSEGCPKFIPMVEAQHYKTAEDQKEVDNDLSDMKKNDIDTLIMGCTHFPIMRHLIQNSMGDDVNLIDPGYETVKQIENTLSEQKLFNKKDNVAKYEFYTTGDVDKFKLVAKDWLKREVNVEHIALNKLGES